MLLPRAARCAPARIRSARLRLRLALPRRDRERVRDMADGLDRALVGEDHRDHVEAAGHLAEALELEIAVGQLPEPVLLAGVDRGLGRVAFHVATGLHLDEDEGLALLGHEVDFPGTGAYVAVQDGETTTGEEAGRLFLAAVSGDLPCVGGHGSLLLDQHKIAHHESASIHCSSLRENNTIWLQIPAKVR